MFPGFPSLDKIREFLGFNSEETKAEDMLQELPDMDKASEDMCQVCCGVPSHRCPDCGPDTLLCSDCEKEFHSHPRRLGHNPVVMATRGAPRLPPIQSGVKDKVKRFNTDSSPQETPAIKPTPAKKPVVAAKPLELPAVVTINPSEFPAAAPIKPSKFPSPFDSTAGPIMRQAGSRAGSFPHSGSAESLGMRRSLVQVILDCPSPEAQLRMARQELDRIRQELNECDNEIDKGLAEDGEYEESDRYSELSKIRGKLKRESTQLQNFIDTGLKRPSLPPESPVTPKVVRPPMRQSQLPSPTLLSPSSAIHPSQEGKTLKGQYIAQPSGDVTASSVKKGQKAHPIAWICELCTFHNQMSRTACEVCTRSSKNIAYVYDEDEPVKIESDQGPSTGASGRAAGGASGGAGDDSEAGPRQSMFYDIAKEKEEAYKRFQMKEELRKKGINVHDEYNTLESEAVGGKEQPIEPVRSMFVDVAEDYASRKERARLEFEREQKLAASGDYRPKETEADRPIVEVKPTPVVVSLRSIPQPEAKPRASTARQSDLTNEMKAMKAASADIVSILRTAEEQGIRTCDIGLALSQDPREPVKWLKTDLPKLCHTLETTLKKKGFSVPPSTVRAALLECFGDKDLAETLITDQCSKVVDDVYTLYDHKYAKDIIRSVAERDGYDVDVVRRELNRRVCARFTQAVAEKARREFPPCEDAYSTLISVLCTDDTVPLKDMNVDTERRVRIALVEFGLQGWGRAVIVVRLIDRFPEMNLEDMIRVVKHRQYVTFTEACNYLQQECCLCFCPYPPSEMLTLSLCSCKMCRDCLMENFEVMIKERHVMHLHCPSCQQPDLQNGEKDVVDNYLQFLATLLPSLPISAEWMDLFHCKLNEWRLQQDEKFRWCANDQCVNGFINENQLNPKMTCPKCRKATCFKCKKLWEPQHDGLSCEDFQKWKEENDPEFQQQGLARHLEMNGIDCPKCKCRYELAKGGCIHFKCTKCGHEFCCGCNKPFINKGNCKLSKNCESAGLHCHHPRNCLYYLRDFDVQELKNLLKPEDLEQLVNLSSTGVTGNKCPVMEQKEGAEGLKDEACGRDLEDGQVKLCQNHLKEYLVSLINKKSIDPLPIMDKVALQQVYVRLDKKSPVQSPKENDVAYSEKLRQDIRNRFPLTAN